MIVSMNSSPYPPFLGLIEINKFILCKDSLTKSHYKFKLKKYHNKLKFAEQIAC